MSGWFGLKSASDLLLKLEKDFARLKGDPTNPLFAFDFFLTAEQLLDWEHPGDARKAQRRDARQSDVLLQIVHHIASIAKHQKAEAQHHKSVSETSHFSFWPERFWPDGFWPKNFWPESLVIELKNDASLNFGSRIGILSLAERVVDLWKQRLEVAT